MSFQLGVIASTEQSDESILDYTYISEENFLLIVILTSKSNLITYYKAGLTQKLESVCVHELYSEWCEPVLVSITPDAAIVLLVQSDGNVLMIPIQTIIAVNWGVSNNVCGSPTLIKVDNGMVESVFRLPTCAVSHISKFSNKPFVIYGNKGGKIFFLDLSLKMVTAVMSCQHSVHQLQLHNDGTNATLLISDFIGAQMVIQLESERCSIRETLAHAVMEDLESSPHRKVSCQNVGGCVTALDSNQCVTKIYDSLNISFETPRTTLKVPESTWMVHFNQKTLLCVSEPNNVWLNMHFLSDSSKSSLISIAAMEDRILGIVPLISQSDELDDCYLVTEKNVVVCKPGLSVNELALNCIASEYFSAKMLSEISNNLQRDQKEMAKTLLKVALEKRGKQTSSDCELNGALALALEVQVEMADIIQILTNANETDLIIPFLTARCERDPKHWSSLLDVYVIKLRKLTRPEDAKERDILENDLKKCFLKCTATKDIFKLLLRYAMWSCVCILISKEPALFSEITASYLLELPSLREIPSQYLVKCVSFLSWQAIEPVAPALLTKILTCLSTVTSVSQLALWANIGETLIHKIPGTATMLFAIATIKLLHGTLENKSAFREVSAVVLASGSNNAAVVTEEYKLCYWGEFTAGSLKFRSETKKSADPSNGRVLKSPVRNATQPHPKLTLFPENVPLPQENETELQVMAVACGTEHVLLLSANGAVYTFGKNRLGQCGVNSKEPVFQVTPIHNNYGRAKRIFAGHYHSGLINEQDEVFLWGWSTYGQLACDLDVHDNDLECRLIPQLVQVLPAGRRVETLALGYAHTLFLLDDGSLYGCGSVSFGQLAIDPLAELGKIPNLTPIKCKSLLRIALDEPVKLVASSYFHSVAVTRSNKIYEWGTAPHTLRMRAFLTKRFNNNTRAQQKAEQETGKKAVGGAAKEGRNGEPRSPVKARTELTREYMQASLIDTWPETSSPIVQVSAGYSHSALITEDGDLYTWGKSLDMQLGHGNKVEKGHPWKLIEPYDTKWKSVCAGRCTTMAISSCGRVFVWGRNDKFQLGLGYTKKTEIQRKVFLRANKEAKSVELPNDNCVVRPTPLPGLQAAVWQSASIVQREQTLQILLARTDQQILTSTSRFLAKHPAHVFCSAQIHLMAGDIANAVEVLCVIWSNIAAMKRSAQSAGSDSRTPDLLSPQRSGVYPQSPTKTRGEPNRNTPVAQNAQNSADGQNGNQPEPTLSPTESVHQAEIEKFDSLLDKTWNLLRIHPFKDIQTLTLVRMLQSRFPVYNRLAADSRLCRLVDPFLEYSHSTASSTNSSIHSAESAGQRKLMDMVVRERFSALKAARVPMSSKLKVLRQRIEQSSPLDQLRFYNDCGHYEKNVIESGPAKAEFATMRNRLRKCSRCVMKGKQS